MTHRFKVPENLLNADFDVFLAAAKVKFTDFKIISQGILKDNETGNFWLFSQNEVWWKILPPIAEKRL